MPRTVHLLVTIELADGRTAEQLRADVERKLGADQTSVTLLNNPLDKHRRAALGGIG
jgi:hypothetical protein